MIEREIVNIWKDDLGEVADEKIKELLPRYTYMKKWDIRPVERKMIEKWLIYWQKIKRLVRNDPLSQSSGFDLDKIRSVPFTSIMDSPGKRVSNRYVFLCPFHKEKTPSFTIFENNHAFCFGCGWHGNVIDYTMEYHRLSFIEACRRLDV